MKIIVGKTAGFCAGVTNAVTKAKQILEGEKGNVYCLGELVHNRQVVEKLEEKGLKTIENIDELNKKEKVIIRAHGVPKEIYEYEEKNKIQLIDLTCPKVLMIHRQAEELSKRKYFVILVAKKEHPEAIGTISFCGKNSGIVEKIEEIQELVEKIKQSKKKNIAIVSQTTFSMKKFEEICIELKEKLGMNFNLEIYNTICSATSLRQKETMEMAKQVEAMVIIGGKNSSNTRKLYEIAKEHCKSNFLIETKQELDIEELKSYTKVGVMAGASTPKESIEEVVEFLEKTNKDEVMI